MAGITPPRCTRLSVFLAAIALSTGLTVTSALAGDLPSPDLTPGVNLHVTKAEICQPGYARAARHVPGEAKHRVYAEYGITSHRPGEYEIDHLISLELGGSNDIKNLWPQSFETEPWNAHVKDRLEDRLHAMFCADEIGLEDAQRAISTNWIVAYQKYFGQ